MSINILYSFTFCSYAKVSVSKILFCFGAADFIALVGTIELWFFSDKKKLEPGKIVGNTVCYSQGIYLVINLFVCFWVTGGSIQGFLLSVFSGHSW